MTRLRGLSPLGPIFGKELRTTARRKRTYVLRFVYLGALLLVLLFMYAAERSDGAWMGVAQRAQRLARMGATFFGVFAVFTWWAMGLVGPVLTSTAINSERLHKTLPVLLMTPITAWQVVAGKLFSRLLIALTLIGLSLPVLAVVRLLGGVELWQVAATLSLCIVTVLFTASVGLLLSTVNNRTYSVILLSYAFLLGIWALVPAFTAMFYFGVMGARGPFQWFQNLLELTNPFFVLVETVLSPRGGGGGLHWSWCVLTHTLFSAALTALSALILRRMAKRENEGSGGAVTIPVEAMAKLAARRGLGGAAPSLECGSAGASSSLLSTNGGDVGVEDSHPHPGPLPGREREPGGATAVAPARVPAPVAGREIRGDNPVLWREVRRPLMAKRWQAIAAFLIVAGVLIGAYLLLANIGNRRDSAFFQPEVQIGFAWIFCAILNALICIIAATAIAQEKESDTWTLLLATPLSAAQIVFGKLMGLVRRMLWPSLLIVGHFLFFTLLGVITPTTFLILLWLIFTTNSLWLATGLYFSLRFKTVTFAVILNMLGPVVLFGGVALVLGIVGGLVFNQHKWAEVVGLYFPYPYFAEAVSELNESWRNSSAVRSPWTRTFWMPVFHEVSWGTFLGWIILMGNAYLAAGAAVVAYTIAVFDRIVGRARQAGPLPPGSAGRADPPSAALSHQS